MTTLTPSFTKRELLGRLLEMERQIRELAQLVEAATLRDDDSTVSDVAKIVGCGIGSQD